MSISFVIPSINRDTLKRTIDSIDALPGDQIIVEFDLPKSGMWGNPQRNKGIKRASGDYLAFIDDDDFYVPGARMVIEKALRENPDRPHIFKMRYPNGDILWKEKKLVPGNISTQMIIVPNKKEMLHRWEAGRNMADFLFAKNWKWPEDQIIWREEIIVQYGHDGANYNA